MQSSAESTAVQSWSHLKQKQCLNLAAKSNLIKLIFFLNGKWPQQWEWPIKAEILNHHVFWSLLAARPQNSRSQNSSQFGFVVVVVVFKTGRFRKLGQFPQPQFRNVKEHLKIPTYLDSPREGKVSQGHLSSLLTLLQSSLLQNQPLTPCLSPLLGPFSWSHSSWGRASYELKPEKGQF